MTWKKLEPLAEKEAGFKSGCLNCGPQPVTLPLDAILAVGFGQVTVSKDGDLVWCGDDPTKELSQVEEKAKEDPDHDWRVCFYGPLSESEYQRQDGNWVLVRKGMGFA